MTILRVALLLLPLTATACMKDAPSTPVAPEQVADATSEPLADAPSESPAMDATPSDISQSWEPDTTTWDITTEPPDATPGDVDSAAEPETGSADVVASPTEPTETAWGIITGSCGAISAAVQAGEAAVLQTTYLFEDSEHFDPSGLSGRSQQRFEEPNAGGSSKCTEVMSMQLLMDCEGATVTKTETEIVYDTDGKLADYLVEVGGQVAGVSVTRAYLGPMNDVYTLDDATDLLDKKLSGIAEAKGNVSAADAWETSIVHVWTLHPEWAQTVATAWEALDPAVQGSTLVLITVEAGSDYIVTDACDD